MIETFTEEWMKRSPICRMGRTLWRARHPRCVVLREVSPGNPLRERLASCDEAIGHCPGLGDARHSLPCCIRRTSHDHRQSTC